jgi:RNA polymerase sigma-70 factor (ECF subfamily)
MGPHSEDAANRAAMPGSLLTTAVLERVQKRDPQALGLLFDTYFGRLYGLAFRLMGQQAAAEDVVQEVILRVHKAAHQLDVTRDPAPWLLTITTNLCREKWRSQQGRQDKQTLSLDAKPEYVANVVAEGASPEQAAVTADRERLLNEALAQLPEAMRLVVVLHDLQGQTHEEIAVLTDEEPPAVRKRYSRALGKLREMLKDHKPDVLA